jgi:TPR repeat protein
VLHRKQTLEDHIMHPVPSGFCRYLIFTIVLGLFFQPLLAQPESPESIGERGIAEYIAGNLMDGMELLYQAAEAGYAPAQARLGYILDQSEENEEAFSWFEKAAMQENAEGLHGLGSMYAKGEGTESNPEEAFRLMLKAANLNYLPAMRVCATAYEQGEFKLDIDNAKALIWLTRAADLGDASSINRLANANRYGHLGLSINLEEAARYQAMLEQR